MLQAYVWSLKWVLYWRVIRWEIIVESRNRHPMLILVILLSFYGHGVVYKISWSFLNYLRSLESLLESRLKVSSSFYWFQGRFKDKFTVLVVWFCLIQWFRSLVRTTPRGYVYRYEHSVNLIIISYCCYNI